MAKKKKQKLSWPEKMPLIASFVMRLTIVAAMAMAGYEKKWFVLFVAGLSLLATFFPSLLERNLKITLPLSFEFLLFLFIYAAVFLGQVAQLYVKLWWWDVVLHGLAGVVLGFFGFLILYTLYRSGRLQAKPFLVALFAFSFAVAIGALWEIFEFCLDVFFHANNQMRQTGVTDTMYDLILDSSGALFSVIIGYTYILHRRKGIYFGRLIEKFFALNPRLKAEKETKKKN